MNNILDPVPDYEHKYKNKISESTAKFFESKLKEAGVNREINNANVKKYNASVKVSDEANGKYNSIRNIRIFINVCAIIFIIISICNFIASVYLGTKHFIFGIIFAILAIGLFVLNSTKLSTILKQREERKNKLEKNADELLKICWNDTRPLCNAFDWNIASNIINETVSDFRLDKHFDMRKLDLLKNKYGYQLDDDETKSIIGMQSGSFNENPFLIVRILEQGMTKKRYRGSLYITWTERVRDSNGNVSYENKSETLYAYVDKPCPDYSVYTYLVYGNESAPGLYFNRFPTSLNNPSENEIELFVREQQKEIHKFEKRAIKEGTPYTPFTNSKFEALFNVFERSDEVQFRLLFTPLAQENLIKLITKNGYYGDYFRFFKKGKLNYIMSHHLNAVDLSQDPHIYYSYDINEIERRLTNYVSELFKNIYFDLAPLLSIPIYQQQKPFEFIYKDHYLSNYPSYESELMANYFDKSYMAPDNAATESILHVNNIKKCGTTDKVSVKASSFYTIPQTDCIPVFGGDGRSHLVPVNWDEYIPTSKYSIIAVKDLNISKQEYQKKLGKLESSFGDKIYTDRIVFQRGLLGILIDDTFSEKDDKVLERTFKTEDE